MAADEQGQMGDHGLSCRSCGGTELVDLGPCARPVSADAGVQPGRLLRCRHCGLGQRHPIPDADAIAAMYADASPDAMDYDYDANAAWSLARRQLRARLDGQPDVAVLDIGCHTGSFLGGLPSAWRRHGIESAQEPCRIARERQHVNLIGTRIEAIDAAWAGKFDAVTMFDVIEHLPDPGAGITQAARLVKPGGALLISSGDLDTWTWRWLGSGHWYLSSPKHLSVISEPFLRFMADQHGLELRGITSLPHLHGRAMARFSESVRAIYWGLRQRGGAWRVPRRLLQSLPGLRKLRHMQSVPWTMMLKDHLLADFVVIGINRK